MRVSGRPITDEAAVIWVAHASRVLTEASCLCELCLQRFFGSAIQIQTKDCFGETPKPTRETRALSRPKSDSLNRTTLGRASPCEPFPAASQSSALQGTRSRCQLFDTIESIRARSSSVNCQFAAFAFARTCSGLLAPAMTDAAGLRESSQAKARSSTV